MSVRFFDASRAAAAGESRLVQAFQRVLRSGRYILGAEVLAFERALAEVLGTREVVGVSSGTDALIVALVALGVGPGDEVIVPAYGFVATAEAVVRVGATPVFADVRRDDLNLDPAAAALLVGPKTRAILAIHLFGAVADVEALSALGQPVIEDAAQAFGAPGVGRSAVSCLSFFPTKNLGGFGDAGAVAANDPDIADRARSLRSHGRVAADEYAVVGGNFRLDELHAALLRERLPLISGALARRRSIAARYAAGLAPLAPRLVPLGPGRGATFNQFVVRVTAPGARDQLRARLVSRAVETQVYYPRTLVEQPCFARFSQRAHAPNAFEASRSTLALPCYPELSDAEVDEVIQAVIEASA